MALEKHVTLVLEPKIGPVTGGGGGLGGHIDKALGAGGGGERGATASELASIKHLHTAVGVKGGSVLPAEEGLLSKLFGGLKGGGIGGAAKALMGHIGGNMMSGVAGGVVGGGGGALAGMLGGPVGAGVVAAAGAVKQVFDEIVGLPDRFMAVAAKISGFVQAANPMAVERFNLAAKDLTAVFGHALTPALKVMEDIVRSIGDATASSDLGASMKALFKEMGSQFEELKPTLMVVTRLIADYAGAVIRSGAAIIKVLGWINDAMGVGTLKKLFGGSAKNMEGASRGMSAQSAGFTGVEQFGMEAAQATFTSGASAADRTAAATETAASTLERINQGIGLLTGQTLIQNMTRAVMGY